MGFLTIFYKYMIQQYFIVQIFLPHPIATPPPRPPPPPRTSNAVVLVHPQSDENVRLQWGF